MTGGPITPDELAHATDRYELGQRVIIPTPTANATGTTVGYGTIGGDAADPHPRLLVLLDEPYRGYVTPETWATDDDPPSLWADTLALPVAAVTLPS